MMEEALNLWPESLNQAGPAHKMWNPLNPQPEPLNPGPMRPISNLIRSMLGLNRPIRRVRS